MWRAGTAIVAAGIRDRHFFVAQANSALEFRTGSFHFFFKIERLGFCDW
jgi:hypothetical protein